MKMDLVGLRIGQRVKTEYEQKLSTYELQVVSAGGRECSLAS